MLLFYVRHGDPIYSPDSLTPLGKRQAEAISKRFAIYGLDEIYSSPSTRARETAQPTCEVLKKEPIILDWCNESTAFYQMSVTDPFIDTHDHKNWCYVHQPTRELMLSSEVRALKDKWYTHPAFAETSFAAGIERIEGATDNFMLSLGYRHDRERGGYVVESQNDKRIAIFAHEGLGKLFLSALLDIPYNEFCTKFCLGFTGMTVINFENVNGFCIPEVLQHSSDAHLYREGLGIMYHNHIPI